MEKWGWVTKKSCSLFCKGVYITRKLQVPSERGVHSLVHNKTVRYVSFKYKRNPSGAHTVLYQQHSTAPAAHISPESEAPYCMWSPSEYRVSLEIPGELYQTVVQALHEVERGKGDLGGSALAQKSLQASPGHENIICRAPYRDRSIGTPHRDRSMYAQDTDEHHAGAPEAGMSLRRQSVTSALSCLGSLFRLRSQAPTYALPVAPGAHAQGVNRAGLLPDRRPGERWGWARGMQGRNADVFATLVEQAEAQGAGRPGGKGETEPAAAHRAGGTAPVSLFQLAQCQ